MPNDFWKSKKKNMKSRIKKNGRFKTGTKFMIYGLLGVFPE